MDQLLVAKAVNLRQVPEWSETTSDLTFLGAATEHTPVASTVWGYVDAELATVGGVAWHVDVRRHGDGWEVERDMTINPNAQPDRPQYVATSLSTIQFDNSSDFAAGLPGAVRELLALTVPDIDSRTTRQAS